MDAWASFRDLVMIKGSTFKCNSTVGWHLSCHPDAWWHRYYWCHFLWGTCIGFPPAWVMEYTLLRKFLFGLRTSYESWVHWLQHTPTFPFFGVVMESVRRAGVEIVRCALPLAWSFQLFLDTVNSPYVLCSYKEQRAPWWVIFFSHPGRNDTRISPSCRATWLEAACQSKYSAAAS